MRNQFKQFNIQFNIFYLTAQLFSYTPTFEKKEKKRLSVTQQKNGLNWEVVHCKKWRHTSGVPQKVLVVSVWEMPSLHKPKSVKTMWPCKRGEDVFWDGMRYNKHFVYYTADAWVGLLSAPECWLSRSQFPDFLPAARLGGNHLDERIQSRAFYSRCNRTRRCVSI